MYALYCKHFDTFLMFEKMLAKQIWWPMTYSFSMDGDKTFCESENILAIYVFKQYWKISDGICFTLISVVFRFRAAPNSAQIIRLLRLRHLGDNVLALPAYPSL